jgi:hypothetical protein
MRANWKIISLSMRKCVIIKKIAVSKMRSYPDKSIIASH